MLSSRKFLNEIRETLEEEVSELNFPQSPRNSRPRAAAVAGSGSSPKMTNENDTPTPIGTSDVIQTPLNAAATDATGVTTAGNITASIIAATTSTILPPGNAADETTRRSLFGAGLYQTVPHRGGREELSCIYMHSHIPCVKRLRGRESSPRARPPPPSGRLGSARRGLGLGLGLGLGWRAFGPIRNILFGPS
ncbi:hypothetical protein IGI04_018807 [Brassica rapa subsp. trilocularis]|uniref:Uncharacterized protein n=1 Tax=Brassica rapa subsp. trilocularis TaxID=1813537 RepID=A0ABQ7ME10_BRACM|nr:hypothetical protein IGI04_018807 [Brassica rapa subsp. trilocularis]